MAMNAPIQNINNTGKLDSSQQAALAQFLVYENSHYLCDSPLTKEQISIGRSQFADVVLDNQAVADFHALVHFHQGQAFLTNNYPEDGLRLNGKSVKSASLQSEDVISIGPFALHFNMGATLTKTESALSRNQNTGHGIDLKKSIKTPDSDHPSLYKLLLVNQYANTESCKNAAARLAKLFKLDPEKTRGILEKEQHTLKKDLSREEAEKWKAVLKNAGVLCLVQNTQEGHFNDQPAVQPQAAAPIAESHTEIAAEELPLQHHTKVAEPKPSHWPQPEYDEGDDLEEDEWEAPFELSEILANDVRKGHSIGKKQYRLMITKSIDDIVTDIRFLDKRQKYTEFNKNGRFLLAEYKSEEQALVNFPANAYGFVEVPGVGNNDLDTFKSDANLHHRRKRIYRMALPESGVLNLGIDNIRYRICLNQEIPSPQVEVVEEENTFTWRHWAASTGTHVIALLCLMIYGYLQAVAPEVPSPHFVKIDPALIDQLKPKPPVEVKPQKKPPAPKPEPKKPVPTKKVAKKTPPRKPLSTAKKRTSKPKTKVAQVSKDPKAGGGFGKGNITNRNINQTGLLSVLGSTKVSGPSDVIASVTNLDAVKVPGASEKNFTVGGLKGSLGNGKISTATGTVVQTKGSNQVLRSAGAKGAGEVAALERGNVGKKAVSGSVTAPMSRTVKIEGGMSREMVKRVIDQHIDEIQHCYETALINNPIISGRIVFEWKILMSGRVGEIRIVASSVNSHDIHACIKSAIKSWQFPKPVGSEVVVSYPFIFDLVAF
jgi:pSer/pThr/pTyr-binding forkhead associated (FHA) protein